MRLLRLAFFAVAVMPSCGGNSQPSSSSISPTDCTLYASASGSDANAGTSASAPTTFAGAASVAQPGAVICIEAGTYQQADSFSPPRSGTPNAYITYQAYGDGPATFVWTGGSQPGAFMFNLDSTAGFPNGYAYLKFVGLILDGENTARNGFFARYGHHLIFDNNYVKNTGGAGIGTVNCDYIQSDHNLIWHNGYVEGATSAISYNGTEFYDNYAGFHNIISNNVISGEQDTTSNTDGNGIIFDLSSDRTPGIAHSNTPPGLIVNNVVYENAGDCIVNFTVSHIWVVNNTCYKNVLNTSILSTHIGEVGDNASMLNWYVNNIVYAWKPSVPSYFNNNGAILGSWFRNMYFVGAPDFTPVDPSQFFNNDPEFVSPPPVNATGDGQWTTAPDPATIASSFELQSTSPAINEGVDPTTLPNVPGAILTDLEKYIYTDIIGNPRPKGAAFDLGAYQQ